MIKYLPVFPTPQRPIIRTRICLCLLLFLSSLGDDMALLDTVLPALMATQPALPTTTRRRMQVLSHIMILFAYVACKRNKQSRQEIVTKDMN